MKTTLYLKDDLYQEAVHATGIEGKTKLIHLDLQSLIQEAARKRLAKLYGAVKLARGVPRRRTA